MILLSDISWWGVALLLLLAGAVVGLLSVIDRQLMRHSLKSAAVMAGQLLLLGIVAWLLYRTASWWADVLFLLIYSVLLSVVLLLRLRLPWQRFLLPLATAAVLSSNSVLISLLFMLNKTAIQASLSAIPLIAILVGHHSLALGKAMQTYRASLLATQSHYRYLLASGASHVEAVMPSVRRSLRAALLPSLRQMASPMLVAPPALLCGLLLGGVSPAAAVLVAAVVLVAMFVQSALAAMLVLWLADRTLFDRQGNLLS